MDPSDNQKPEVRDGERIAKVMARAGLCSRRDAEDWIAAGRVSVNGEVLASPAYNVSHADDIRVDGEPLRERQRTRLFAFHKPKGLVTTSHDPEGRRTVFEALPEELPRVVTIGRLDINTEGLLLLTNDGGLARVLELPETGWLRRYRVRAHGAIEQATLDSLKDGVTVEGVHYAGIEARLERTVGSNVWLVMGLREGKNREIKRVLEHLGLQVNRLIRISFGPFELADLPEGAVEEVPTRVLRDQLGARLAKKADADFDAPILEAVKPEPAPLLRPGRDVGLPRLSRERGGAPRSRDGEDEGRPRERGPDHAGEARPVSEPRRPGGATPQRKRKHISILRAEAREEAAEDRRRIERSATKDRKGRQVKVERISTVRAPGAPAAPQKEFARGGAGERPARPQRDRAEGGEHKRFDRAAGDRPARPPRDRSEARSEGGERKRFDRPAGDRPARPPRDRSEARSEGGERKRFDRPAGDRPARPPRDRTEARSEGGERKRFDRPAGDRPARPPRDRNEARSEGGERKRFDRPAGDRPARPPRERSEARSEGGERKRFDRPAGDRPARPPRERSEARSEGGERKRFDRPAGDRPARPPRERSEGRPEGGERKRFDRPAGDRPARPPRERSEGRPEGGRPPRKGPPEGGRRPPFKGGPRTPGKRP